MAASAPAAALQVCVEQQPLLPLTNGGREPPGYAELLIKDTARNLGMSVEEVVAPWARCQKMVSSGFYDAVLNMTYARENRTMGVFPMTQPGTPDSSKALGRYISFVFRRIGSPADLVDGKIVYTKKPVGIQIGYQLHRDLVEGMGWSVIEITNSASQMAKMLAAGRVDLVVGDFAMQREVEANFKTVLEPLPAPLNESFVYLVFSKKYYDGHSEDAERFWSEMARVRNSQDYADEISAIRFDE
jgi:ABC-type amino acid transport substrate-binding protein